MNALKIWSKSNNRGGEPAAHTERMVHMIMLNHETVCQAVEHELNTFHFLHDPHRGYNDRQVGYDQALRDYMERLILWHRMPGSLERLPLEYVQEIKLLESLEKFRPDESRLKQVFGHIPKEMEDRAWGYLEGVDTLKRVLHRLAERARENELKGESL